MEKLQNRFSGNGLLRAILGTSASEQKGCRVYCRLQDQQGTDPFLAVGKTPNSVSYGGLTRREYEFDKVFAESAEDEVLQEVVCSAVDSMVAEGRHTSVMWYPTPADTMKGGSAKNVMSKMLQKALTHLESEIPISSMKFSMMEVCDDKVEEIMPEIVAMVSKAAEEGDDKVDATSSALLAVPTNHSVLQAAGSFCSKLATPQSVEECVQQCEQSFSSSDESKEGTFQIVQLLVRNPQSNAESDPLRPQFLKLFLVTLAPYKWNPNADFSSSLYPGFDFATEKADLTSSLTISEPSNPNRNLTSLSATLQAISGRACFVPFESSSLTRLLKDGIAASARPHLIVNLGCNRQDYQQTLHGLYLAMRTMNWCSEETVEMPGVLERFDELMGAQPHITWQSALDWHHLEREAFEALHCSELQTLTRLHRNSNAKGPGPGMEGLLEHFIHSHELHIARNHHLENQLAVSDFYRINSYAMCEEVDLKRGGERVLFMANARAEREKEISLATELEMVRKEVEQTKEALHDTQAELFTERVTKHKAKLQELSTIQELEALESVYGCKLNKLEAQVHKAKAEACSGHIEAGGQKELHKIIEGLHQDLVQKNLQVYTLQESSNKAEARSKKNNAELNDVKMEADRDMARHRHDRILYMHAMGLAESLANYIAANLLVGRTVVTSNDTRLIPILRGLETLLKDRLVDGVTLWDFVQHTQMTMEKSKSNFFNNSAKEQISAISGFNPPSSYLGGREPLFYGRLWIIYSLTNRALLDGIVSLQNLRASYYCPDAFMAMSRSWNFILAMIRQLHLLNFKLNMADVQCFESASEQRERREQARGHGSPGTPGTPVHDFASLDELRGRMSPIRSPKNSAQKRHLGFPGNSN